MSRASYCHFLYEWDRLTLRMMCALSFISLFIVVMNEWHIFLEILVPDRTSSCHKKELWGCRKKYSALVIIL
jgi:hypothetical protein